MSLAIVDPALIEDLVDANHILFHLGVVDGFGHVSARHPEDPGRFFISRSMAPALVTQSDIMMIDLDGQPLSDSCTDGPISSASSTARSIARALTSWRS
jgi:ribulose-5-phosphate 4-epimerase/fuculose-1-phosphate aldolase